MRDVAPAKPEATAPGWHPCWEEAVYARGRHLNRYPYEAVVGFLLGRYPRSTRAAANVLEVGFGAGNNLWCAAREGFRVAGVEASPSAVAFAQARFAADGLQGDLRQGSFVQLPWGGDCFDLAIDRMALCHAPGRSIRQALGEIARVLKPGGWLLSMVYSDRHPDRHYGGEADSNDYAGFTGGYFAGLGTVHFFTRDEIEAWYGTHFALVQLRHTSDEVLLGERHGNAYWTVQALKRS